VYRFIICGFLASSLAHCGQAYSAPVDLEEQLMELCDRINVLEFYLMEETPLTDCEAKFEQSLLKEENEEIDNAVH